MIEPPMPEVAPLALPPLVLPPLVLLADEPDLPQMDPEAVVLTCANCGASMGERKCKLICQCGYFLSCSDYL